MGLLRLVLAIGVAISHFGADILLPNGLTFDYRWTLGIAGIHSVILFYVISGFLISYVLERKYPLTRDGTIAFYLARAERIYPLWLLVCVFVIVMYGGWLVWAHGRTVAQMFSLLFLFGSDWFTVGERLSGATTTVFFGPLGVAWTLGAELTFYVVAPFLFRSWRLLFAAILFSLVARILVSIFGPTESAAHITWMYFFFPCTFIFFIMGHLARVAYRLVNIPAVVGWLCLGASFAISENDPSGLVEGNLAFFSVMLFALALPALFEATKNFRVLNFLGDQTYPLYLTHLIALQLLWGGYGLGWFAWGPRILALAKATPDLGGTLASLAFVQFAILVAIVAYCIELAAKAATVKCFEFGRTAVRRLVTTAARLPLRRAPVPAARLAASIADPGEMLAVSSPSPAAGEM